MGSNQTPFMNKEFWTPLYYTARLELRFCKIGQKKACKAIIRKKMCIILLKKHQITLLTWMRKKFVIKKMERGKSYFTNNVISNEKIGSY